MNQSLEQILAFFSHLIHPSELEAQLRAWGWVSYPILSAIVFAETGILAGFFFPGDSLLFVAGFVASMGIIDIVLLNAVLIVSAILGDAVGYYLGKKAGPKVFHREDSVLFKKEYLEKTRIFYEKHGGKTIILARFIPIVRTFAPFVAGVAGMGYRKFAYFNVAGGVLWVTSMTLLGYFLGNIAWVKANLEKAVLIVIFISLLPVLHQALSSRLKRSDEKAA